MPRKLPWETEAEKSHLNTTPKRQSPHPKPPTPGPSVPPLIQGRQRPLEQRADIRSPSTSPPPEPPAQQFMIAGPSGDDRYRMVEDELLHTARRFTTHLHRAEYTRLKRLAAAQNAAAIREIERPVVPGLGTATGRRGAASTAARRRGLRRAEREGEAPWVGSSLQGLMETPRAEDTGLTGVGVTSRSRAAVAHVSSSSPPGAGGWREGDAADGGRDRVEAVAKNEDEDGDVDEDEDDPFGVRQRRARRQKSREQMRRTGERETETPKRRESDTIPWFF